jgi:D-alanyl-D-alanine carboxypeptidase (penicillin-binding protein 5/6)
MTALITLERTRPDAVFPAPAYRSGAAESTIGLRAGERMTVRDLLEAVMLPSANDAANDLAVNVGGSRARFVRMMNARARAIGLADTHYSTPVGLDSPGNYSSASDLARLAVKLMRNPLVAKIAGLPSATIHIGSRARRIENRNDLVARYRFVDGIKTGHTNGAGYVLVGAAHGNGAHVISAVLGTRSIAARDGQSLALLRYGIAQFHRVHPVARGRAFGSAKVRWYDGRTVPLVAGRGVTFTVRRGRAVRTLVHAPRQLTGPKRAGEPVGRIEVAVRGRRIESVPLVTAAPVPGAGFVRKATVTVGGPVVAVALLVLLGGSVLLVVRLRTLRKAPRGTASN